MYLIDFEGLSVDDIIELLNDLNVEFDIKQFKEQTNNYLSSCRLAKDHYSSQCHSAVGAEVDIIWIAIGELWERIVPEKINSEMIFHMISDDYNDMDDDEFKDYLKKWDLAWKLFKSFIPPTVTKIKQARDCFPEEFSEFFYDWCSEYENILFNAGYYFDDDTYFERKIEFIQEFKHIFSHSSGLMIQNMTRAEAETYGFCGNLSKALEIMRQFIEDHPEDVFGYASMGDLYLLDIPDHNLIPDYQKAEDIYRLGLSRAVEDRDVLEDRLEDLERARGENIIDE